MHHPKARQDDLVVQELFDELVIYDRQRGEVHSLNQTAALVWQQCDGQTSPADLAARLPADLDPPQAETLVWLALDRLERARLLEQKGERPQGLTISRRQALRALGLSVALLPVIATIVAPPAAQALTCVGNIESFDIAGSPIGGACDTTPWSFLDDRCDTECPGLGGYTTGYATFCEDDGVNLITKIWCCCS